MNLSRKLISRKSTKPKEGRSFELPIYSPGNTDDNIDLWLACEVWRRRAVLWDWAFTCKTDTVLGYILWKLSWIIKHLGGDGKWLDGLTVWWKPFLAPHTLELVTRIFILFKSSLFKTQYLKQTTVSYIVTSILCSFLLTFFI